MRINPDMGDPHLHHIRQSKMEGAQVFVDMVVQHQEVPCTQYPCCIGRQAHEVLVEASPLALQEAVAALAHLCIDLQERIDSLNNDLVKAFAAQLEGIDDPRNDS